MRRTRIGRVLALDLRRARAGAPAWSLGALLLLLPFEPRRPTFGIGGLQVTLLELLTAACLALLAAGVWPRAAALLRRPPLPLLFLLAYAAAHLLSALFAAESPGAAFKFSLRMLAMAGFALLVAAAPGPARRAGLTALAAAGALVAVLAVLEGVGLRQLDPLLARFREMPFNVAGTRRASAGSEYPNLAAAFIMYGLLAALPRLGGRAAALGTYTLLAVLGMLFTYSRGALGAALVGLVALATALGPRTRSARAPLAAALVLLLASSAFAWRGEAFRLRLASEGTSAWYAASYEPGETSLTLIPGEERTTPVRVTNSGLKAWRVEEQFHLSYHWYDTERRFLTDGPRTVLPRDMAGGESIQLAALVRAPLAEGRYLLVWDMVHERTTWFSGQGVAPASVPVRVASAAGRAAAPAPEEAPPGAALAWRPSRWELWSLALGMWRERPLTGVGSDNFRRLYGPRAGQPYWDARVYANNTLLEAAATTGSLGALALGGSLLASLALGLRRARAAAPQAAAGQAALAAFALVAGIAAHGVVDYVLAFTGHYLVFGFAVGAIAAPRSEDEA
jgi:O-antigen ligase